MSREPDRPSGGGGRIVIAEPAARRGRVLLTTLITLVVLVFAFVMFSQFWTDVLWFRSVGASEVFTTQLWTRVGLFVVFGGLIALAIAGNAWIAYHFRPFDQPLTAESSSLERYRLSLEPVRRVLVVGLCVVVGVIAGASAASEWETWLLWRNQTPFGTTDPQFGMDVSFYAFTLPMLRFVLGFLFATVIVCLLVAVVVHYLYGGLRLQSSEGRTSTAARAQISILLGVFMLLKAGAYVLDRYDLAVSQDGLVPGLTYTDVYAVLPAKNILVFVSLICAGLFFVCAVRNTWRLAATGFVLLLASSILIGAIYPALVQQLQVNPNVPVNESPYISRSITATRAAYGIANTQIKQYQAASEATPEALADSAGTIKNIRILDPTVVSPTFAALEQNRTYYSFPDTLDVDRYSIDGQTRGSVVAVRELNLSGIADAQRNWANDHLIYTHGFGFVGAYDNTTTDGKPLFFQSGLPGSGVLKIDQPRIYFGESSPTYSIVGAPAGSDPRELDYPPAQNSEEVEKYTYQGSGGVPVGSLLNRLLYAVKYQEPNILLSDLVNDDSRILEVRDPRDRVEKVAPWLTLDGDAYPAVVDGRIEWIVDGYTTTDAYPNSEATTLDDATSDSLTANSRTVVAQGSDEVNYIRNSVKATVDAYDGTVTLSLWDETDPIAQSWAKVFPGLLQPKSSISADLMDHLRYPADLFKVQRKVLAQYHVTDPNSFYSGTDFWSVPTDPAKRVEQPQPPYYLQVQLPGEDQPVYSLTTTFAPQKRQTLAAFMAVDSEPGPGYGTITVLQLPGDTIIPGPQQQQNNFVTNPSIKSELTLLQGNGTSDLEYGNLLSLPVAGGILYVEPVYIRAGGTSGYPLLRKMLVGFGSKVAFEDNLSEALASLFQQTTPSTPTEPGTGNGNAQAELKAAVAAAQQAYDDGVAALAKNDWAAYGEANERLKAALSRATAAQKAIDEANAADAGA